MSVTMICPNLKCGQTVVAPDSARGKIVRCVHCQQLFMVPKPTNDAPAASQAKADGQNAGRRAK